jgi:hypothetical protein
VSDAVTIVGIVTPAAVGVAGLWIQARRERELRREQARDERVKQLSEVLDEGGQAITEALFACDRRRAAPPDQLQATGEAFDRKVERVFLVEDRIAIRLGTGAPALGSYQTAARELNGLSKLLYEAQGQVLTEEQMSTADHGKAEVERAQGEFFDRARLWLGVSERPRRWGKRQRLQELQELSGLASESITEALFAFDRRRAAVSSRRSVTGKAFDASVERVQLMENRLAIRLAENDQAAVSYRRAVRGLQDLSRLAYEAHGEELTAEGVEPLRAEVESAQRDFIACARGA